MNLNPSIIGLTTELECQLYLVKNGYNVLVPIGNYQKYDIVVEKNRKFIRIQVKHATEKDEGQSFMVSTKYEVRDLTKNQRTRKEKYTEEDCDYFMTSFNGQFYIFPVFGTTETKFWLKDKIRLKTQKLAKNYLAEKVLQEL